MESSSKILVAGHRGMVGSAIVRELNKKGFRNILAPSRSELDFIDQSSVVDYFHSVKPEYVFLAAAKVGGIYANNTYPADFIYQNLMIQANVINSAYDAGVKSLLFLGSSCIYPKLADQPMAEAALLTGALEPSNEPYAMAKIAGIKLCESYNRQHGTDFRSVMPTNLYGPNDNFHPENSHVVPALLRRFYFAKKNNEKSISIWGTGKAKREFLHVDDMASACVFLMQISKQRYQSVTEASLSHINIGTGKDIDIAELANKIKDINEYEGDIIFDSSKPDGAPRKLLDITKLVELGWVPSIGLNDGLKQAHHWLVDNLKVIDG